MKNIYFTIIPYHLSSAIPLSTWTHILESNQLYCDRDLDSNFFNQLPRFKTYQFFQTNDFKIENLNLEQHEITFVFSISSLSFRDKLEQISQIIKRFRALSIQLIYLPPPNHFLLSTYQSLGLIEQSYELYFQDQFSKNLPSLLEIQSILSTEELQLFQKNKENIVSLTALIDDAIGPSPTLSIDGQHHLIDKFKKKIPHDWKFPMYMISGDLDESVSQSLMLPQLFPLKNQEIVVTRSDAQISALAQPLKNLGAQVLSCPSIEIKGINDDQQIDQEIKRLRHYDWVIFTSTNGVDYFFKRLYDLGFDMRALGNAKIACIGSATSKALASWGLKSDLLPKQYVAESLIEAFEGLDPLQRGKSVLIPRAKEAREILPIKLKEMGLDVVILPIYQTVGATLQAEMKQKLLSKPEVPRLICFTANSTVEHFSGLFSREELSLLQSHSKVICIGPISGEKARILGYDLVAQADIFNITGLIEAIVHYVQKN
jgi:uroporphyrinogen-III synthase